MAKRKTLPKHFELLVQTGTDEEIKAVFKNCDINAYGGYYKSNALSFPLSYDMMKWLIEEGADINYIDKALHCAIPTGNVKLVQCLVEAGIDTAGRNWNDDTPLESAFHRARTFDLVELEPVTKYLLSVGIPVTEKLQNYMLEVAKDIEFRREDMNPEYMPELDAALDSLYALLSVEPVPRRAESTGTQTIMKCARPSLRLYRQVHLCLKKI